MAKEKQHVFSARTTEEGLKQLNELKAKLNISWDDLVIDAVCAHYGLDKAIMSLPRKEKPIKEAQPTEQPPTEDKPQEQPVATEQERPTDGKRPAKKPKAKGGKKSTGAKADEVKQ